MAEGRRATDMEQWRAIWDEHKGKIVGGVGGLALGVFILRHGLWRTLFVVALLAIGFWIGATADEEGWSGVGRRAARLFGRRR